MMLRTAIEPRVRRLHRALFTALLLTLGACATLDESGEANVVMVSVMGTNDVHGELLEQPGRGGLTTLSGYVAALREARDADGGHVLLIDAGDMWQGTLESNLTEGEYVVDVYNALGYAAAAIGNHEFDFGPVGPASIPQNSNDDPQGALKVRASEARFPLLAANVIDEATGLPVAWDNVQPSTVVDIGGIKVGIIGVMTSHLKATTISANVVNVRVAPLAETITAEARALRQAGAALVIVTAHAGSRCEAFDNPVDLSSCDTTGEIFEVARSVPAGLVDHIIAGHVHQGIAHVVNGISITSSFASTHAFSRVDFLVDRDTGMRLDRLVFPPQRLCASVDPASGDCAALNQADAVAARYEGRVVQAMPEITAIVARAADRARQLGERELGAVLETPITVKGRPEAALGNLMTDAILASIDGDIAIHNVFGGIRASLPAGPLTYGSLYRMFPFDNRIAVVELSGHELRRIVAVQAHRAGRRAGFAGMRVFVACEGGQMRVRMLRPNGREIDDADRLRVIANDFLLLGGDGILTPVTPDGGFDIPANTPLVRDVLAGWFEQQQTPLRAEQFLDETNRRWNLPESVPANCAL